MSATQPDSNQLIENSVLGIPGLLLEPRSPTDHWTDKIMEHLWLLTFPTAERCDTHDLYFFTSKTCQLTYF